MSNTNGVKCKNPRDNQVKISGWEKFQVPGRFFSHEDSRYVDGLPLGRVPNERADVERTFEHICGLLKAVTLAGPEHSRMLLYLDGYDIEEVEVGLVNIKLSEDIKKPTTRIRFKGTGPRYGTLNGYKVTDVCLTFKDEEQMRAYISEKQVAPKVARIPDNISVYHHDTDSGGGIG